MKNMEYVCLHFSLLSTVAYLTLTEIERQTLTAVIKQLYKIEIYNYINNEWDWIRLQQKLIKTNNWTRTVCAQYKNIVVKE